MLWRFFSAPASAIKIFPYTYHILGLRPFRLRSRNVCLALYILIGSVAAKVFVSFEFRLALRCRGE